MPRLILPLVVFLAALAGCSADDSPMAASSSASPRPPGPSFAPLPDADWAMSLCKRVFKRAKFTSKGPQGIELLDARAVTRAEAKAMDGGFVPLNGQMAPIKYGVSCKIRFLHPRIAGIRDGRGAGAAVLGFEEVSLNTVDRTRNYPSSFVIDPHWAK